MEGAVYLLLKAAQTILCMIYFLEDRKRDLKAKFLDAGIEFIIH